MLQRYSRHVNGKLIKRAKIYTKDEHRISLKDINPDAVWTIQRLKKNGYNAYIVGGAVRDLLLGRKPKDFDIVTNAHPYKIKKMFYKALVIGKRFKLVHLFFSQEKYLEISTFRSSEAGPSKNIYGNIEEDSKRRDFSINALYYCPLTEVIIDYVNGFTDINIKKIKPLLSAAKSFREDPVRIIRAIKYAGTLNLKIPFAVKWAMVWGRKGLHECSQERLKEELFKILASGKSLAILDLMHRLRVLPIFLPQVSVYGRSNGTTELWKGLKFLDEHFKPNWTKGQALAAMFRFLPITDLQEKRIKDLEAEIKALLSPMNIPKKDITTVAKRLWFNQVQHEPHPRPRRKRKNTRQSA